MKVLSQKALAALTADDRKAYDKELEAFIAEFQTANPNGVECTVNVIGLSNQARIRKGTNRRIHAYTYVTADALVTEQIGESAVLLRPAANADIIAANAGFMNHIHMAIALIPFSAKGTLKFTMNLRVKGDEYAAGKTYKTTSFAQDNFEFIPSAAASQRIAEVSHEAAVSGFNSLMHGGIGVNNTAPTPTAAADNEDIDL